MMRKSFVAATAAFIITSMGVTGLPQPASAASACSAPSNGYGRMFPSLDAASWSQGALTSLGDASIADAEAGPTPPGEPDAEDNRDIPAGYTYFGQFVDHDLTFDDRPNDLVTPTPVSDLVNGRTPQLDLDSLYGSGPAVSTTLYESDAKHLKVGALLTGSSDVGARDLPRAANGSALIGDPRNDENRIVASVHSMFIRLHNQTVDRISANEPNLSASQVFAKARQQVTWNYQWLIVNDYLPKIAGKQLVDSVATRTGSGWRTNLRFYDACQQMPVEFSVAAYRFGHSMVRAFYRPNASIAPIPVFSGTYVPSSDLTGFSPSPTNFGIDWNLFVPTGRSGAQVVQPAYKFDNSLTNSLSLLPLPTTGIGPANLALRNLLRSQQLGLPSGQDVARAMGVTPLSDDRILVGKAVDTDSDAVTLTSISAEFAGRAPLWTYVLAESMAQAYPIANGRISGPQRAPFRLGPVGGRIVTETIIGLMTSDPASILNHPGFTPRAAGAREGEFTLRTLVDTLAAPAPAPRPTPPPTVAPRPRVDPPRPGSRTPLIGRDPVPPLLRPRT